MRPSSIPPHPRHRKLYLEESVAKARAREAEEAERRRRARDKLASYMRHARPSIKADSSWEEWLAEHDREPEVKAVRRRAPAVFWLPAVACAWWLWLGLSSSFGRRRRAPLP